MCGKQNMSPHIFFLGLIFNICANIAHVCAHIAHVYIEYESTHIYIYIQIYICAHIAHVCIEYESTHIYIYIYIYIYGTHSTRIY